MIAKTSYRSNICILIENYVKRMQNATFSDLNRVSFAWYFGQKWCSRGIKYHKKIPQMWYFRDFFVGVATHIPPPNKWAKLYSEL